MKKQEEQGEDIEKTETTLSEETSEGNVEQEQTDMEEKEEEGASPEEEEAPKRPLSLRILYGVIEVMIYILIILLGAVAIPKYVMQRTLVDGPSMQDNLHDEDNILVEKISPKINNLDRFDVIVFYPYYDAKTSETSFWYDLKKTTKSILHIKEKPEHISDKVKESREYYVKRIIGLPGETIQIKGDDIYIDGEIIEEDYGKMPITNGGIAEEPLTLGDDEYFVMGDNRAVSFDSRFDEIGPVKKEKIAGKALLRIWPFKDFGIIH